MADVRGGDVAALAATAAAARAAIAAAATFRRMSGAISGAVAVTGELDGATGSLVQNFGLARKTAADWAVVSRVNGIETTALVDGFDELALNARNAARGAGEQSKSFKQLGVSQRLLQSGNLNAILLRTADGMRRLGPSVDRNQLGLKLFGKGWQALRPLLSGGARSINEQLGAARKYVPALQNGSRASQALSRAQREQRMAMLGLKTAVGRALAPALTVLAQTMADLIANVQHGRGPWAALRAVLGLVAIAIAKVSGFFMKHRTLAQTLLVTVLALRAGLAGLVTTITTVSVARKALKLVTDNATKAQRIYAATMALGRRALLQASLALVPMRVRMANLRAAVMRTTIAQKALNLVMRMNTIGLVVTAVAGFIAVFAVAYKRIGAFRRAVDSAWRFIKKNWPILLSVLGGPITIATALIIKNWKKIRGGFENAFTGLKELAARVFGGVRDVVAGGFNWIIDKINAVIKKVRGVGKFLSFGQVNIPTIDPIPTGGGVPGAADGGVVSRPGSVLVGERGPEILRMPRGASVIPLDHPAAARTAAGAGGARELHVHVNVDRRELTRAVLRGVTDLEAFA